MRQMHKLTCQLKIFSPGNGTNLFATSLLQPLKTKFDFVEHKKHDWVAQPDPLPPLALNSFQGILVAKRVFLRETPDYLFLMLHHSRSLNQKLTIAMGIITLPPSTLFAILWRELFVGLKEWGTDHLNQLLMM